MSNLNFSRDLLKLFIFIYKKFPCLWDRNCATYRLQEKRREAVCRLTQLVNEYHPNATAEDVMKKINSLRACVRREFNKVQASLRTARSHEDIYKPRLWYYNLLAFVFEPRGDTTEITFDDIYDENPEVYRNYPAVVSVIKYVMSLSKEKHNNEVTEPNCTEREDNDVIGKFVAAKLNELPTNMRILVKKIIFDLLLHAET